jgi:hypothetical protein
MTHPSETSLALFAGGELGLWERWKTRRHISRCDQCRQEAAAFEFAREWLRETGGEMPAGVNWNRLAADMKANIRVGLVAGECIGPSEEDAAHVSWKAVATVIPIVLVLVFGWLLQPRRPALTTMPETEGIVLQATAEGIELREGNRAFSLQNPDAGDVTYTVNAQGSLRARYIDSETGQVTINHVYVH